MEKTIVKTDNYLLVVDDSDLKNGEYCIDGYGHLLPFVDLSVLGLGYDKETIKKITFHLPLNNAPILEGVLLLPPLEDEDDVQNLAKDYLFNDYQNHFNVKTNDEQFGVLKGYMNGYNKAREKYKFTEEDMMKAYRLGNAFLNSDSLDFKETFDDLIQSLSQSKTPTHFDFEMEDELAIDGHTIIGRNPKTTTNSQGQEVACGKYVYAS